MRKPTLNCLTTTRPLIYAAVFAGIIGCGAAQDVPSPAGSGATAGSTSKATKATASSPAKVLFGQCPPGSRAEFATITDQPLGLAGAWVVLGKQDIAHFISDGTHGLALAKELDAIPVVWIALQDGWPDGKFVDQDIIDVAHALAEFKNSKGEPQMSIVRLFLEPWNRNWHGPKD